MTTKTTFDLAAERIEELRANAAGALRAAGLITESERFVHLPAYGSTERDGWLLAWQMAIDTAERGMRDAETQPCGDPRPLGDAQCAMGLLKTGLVDALTEAVDASRDLADVEAARHQRDVRNGARTSLAAIRAVGDA